MQAVKTDNRWHLDKRVPIAMILTLLTYGVAGLWFLADVKKDVELLKAYHTVQRERDVAAVAAQRDRDTKQDLDAFNAATLVRGDIKELGGKMDRLLERSPPKR